MAKHERPGKSDEWYTPPHIFGALGTRFDLDVAAPETGPLHVPASEWLFHDSLSEPWFGFVWMNPPFGGRNGLVPWLDKFVSHANGICLVPDRTGAPWWQTYMPRMANLLFVAPKIHFIPGPGVKKSSPAQGTCLGAIGMKGTGALITAAQRNLGVLAKVIG